MTDPDAELASELRAVLARFHREAAPPERVREAAELARRMHTLLEGAPRTRWFDGDLADGRRSRQSRFNDRSLYRGRANPMAPPLVTTVVEQADGTKAIEGRVTVGRMYEGPPNGVHGGYVAGLFDDVLGATQTLIDGPTGLTGTLRVRYRNLTPLDTELVFRAWVHDVSGRRIRARATCHADDVLTADAEALFVRVDMAELARRALRSDG